MTLTSFLYLFISEQKRKSFKDVKPDGEYILFKISDYKSFATNCRIWIAARSIQIQLRSVPTDNFMNDN